MTNKYKQWEGAVDVNGDQTPITREPINQITTEKWSTMNLGELHQQRSYLLSRMGLASGHSPQLLTALEQGMTRLDAIIASIDSNDTGLM